MEVYVACPYSHEVGGVRRMRSVIATRYAAKLWAGGVSAFSPLTHNHGLASICPKDYEPVRADFGGWEKIIEFDLEILSLCQQVHVLELPGWEHSRGVRREINYAIKAGKGMGVAQIDVSKIEQFLQIDHGTIEKIMAENVLAEEQKK